MINHFKLFPVICFSILLICGNTYAQQGLKAEYYDGTNFDRLETVKYVPNIDQSWNYEPPVSNINPHECSIRWTGNLKTAKSGTYTFSAQVDDGIRVWVNNKLIINQWGLNDLGVFEGTLDLVAHKEYKLKVEYFNALNEGEVRLLWRLHKEKLSWYERLFGENIEYAVIPPLNFLPPVEPVKKKEPVVLKTKKVEKKAPPKKKVVIPEAKKQTATKVPEKKVVEPKPVEVNKPKPTKPIVLAKEVEKYTPKNVQFKKGKTIILESSYQELNSFVRFMLKYPHLKVKVEGHTDVVGDPELNLQLSKDRATTISNYLIKKGIASKRITSDGYGSTQPLYIPVKKGKAYPANRRVVFIVEGM